MFYTSLDTIAGQVLYVMCLSAGIILFGLGVIGAFDLPYKPADELTILLVPTYGPVLDRIFWSALAALGFWLSLAVKVRPAAAIALVLVISKMMAVSAGVEL